MALWMTPMRPPCTCPTCSQRGKGSETILTKVPGPQPPSLYALLVTRGFLTVQKPLLVRLSEFKFSF